MAVYKHSGISNGSMHFEWFSNDPDPLVSNPYPMGEYPNLSFETKPATKEEEALFFERRKNQDAWMEKQVLKDMKKSDFKTQDDLVDFMLALAKHI